MTSAETLGWFAIILLIGVPAVALLASWAAFRLPFMAESERTPLGFASLGAPGAFREPADPSYVEQLIRVQGRAAVFHKPDPVLVAEPEHELLDDIEHPPVSPARPFSMPLAELVASARRYVVPVNHVAAHVPHHASHTVDTKSGTTVGRHRALPQLVAA
jgi:hypothetical protein